MGLAINQTKTQCTVAVVLRWDTMEPSVLNVEYLRSYWMLVE